MFTLTELKVKNFLSYRDLNLKFAPGLFLIEGYNFDEDTANGSGKSAIIDAICFALYGDLPRKVKYEEVITWGESNLDMQLTFNKKGKHCFIHRSRNPNVLNFYIDTILKNGKDNRETQQIINDTLGISLTTFLMSIYFSQNTDVVTQFLFANDDGKKDVLTELLDLYIFDTCLDNVKKDLNTMSSKITELTRDIDNLNRQANEKQREEDRLKKLGVSFEESRERTIEIIQSKITSLQEDEKKVEQEYDKECKSYKEMQKKKDYIELLRRDLVERDLTPQVRELKNEKNTLSSKLYAITEQQKSIQKLVAQGKCPTCKQPISEECLISDIPVQEDPAALREQISQIDIKINDLEAKINKNQEVEYKIKGEQMAITASENLFTRLVKSRNDTKDRLAKQIQSYNTDIEAQRTSINNYMDLAGEYISQIVELKTEIIKKSKTIQKANKFIDTYNVLVKAFGKEGIKSFVFTKVINELNFYLAQYLKDMFDADVTLKFDIQSLGANGQIKQKMDTVLLIDGQRRNINILSGGERAKLILATNFALSNIISARCSSAPNFICMDECFTGLDVHGKEKMMSFLRKLSESKDFIYVVDHQTEFKSSFDGCYKVEKRKGISQITQGE